MGDYLFTDADFVNRLSTQNRNLFQKIYAEIKYLCKLATAGSKEARQLEKVKKIFDEAYRSTQQKNTADSGVKYDLDENLGQQLQDWLEGGGKKNGSYNGHYFELGTTPNVLLKHGAKSVPLIMYEDCVAKVTGLKGDDAHSIALDEIARLPSQLNDPILLFKGSVENSFVALTEMVDKQGNDVVVAVHLRKQNGRTDINKIASLYSKSDYYGNNRIIGYVQNQINQGNLLDASINKAPNWFTTRGLQLPKVVQTILDANNSISQNSQKSTPEGKKSLSFNEDTKKFPVGSRVTYGEDISLFPDDFPMVQKKCKYFDPH